MSNVEHDHKDEDASRREFLYITTGAAGAVAVGAAVLPLINQMNPSADVRALASIRVDISQITEGTQITVEWQGKPVFIRNRTPEEIAEARAVDLGSLPDNDARNDNLGAADAADENRALDEEGRWLVQMGLCTHFGCVPVGNGAGDFGGWFCPCHGSHYDTSGRIRRGPAPENLPIPIVAFAQDQENVIILGEET